MPIDYKSTLLDDLSRSWVDIFTIVDGSLELMDNQAIESFGSDTSLPLYVTLIWKIEAVFSGQLEGISGNNETVEIRGTTVAKYPLDAHEVTVIPGEPPTLHTAIDWSKVLAQLAVPSHNRTMGGFTD